MHGYTPYEQLNEAEIILLVAEGANGIDEKRVEAAFDGLDSDEKLPMTWPEVATKINKLLPQKLDTIDDVARSVVIQLSKQIGDINGKVMLLPFTYQDTKMIGPFAGYLDEQIQSQIEELSNPEWSVVTQTKKFMPKSNQITSELAKASHAQWLIYGTCWERDNRIELIANLRDVKTGKILAAADVLFDASILEPTDLALKPINFQQAMMEQKALSEGEIISNQLQVGVWTNKGNKNLLFTEGETMKVYVRVNRAAHIRLLYTLVSGKRTLLYDDHYISQSRANQVVEIPQRFECAPPFGAEFLVVAARTTKFAPLKTVEIDGYYLVADAPAEAIARFRSIGKRKAADILQAEARLSIATLEDTRADVEMKAPAKEKPVTGDGRKPSSKSWVSKHSYSVGRYWQAVRLYWQTDQLASSTVAIHIPPEADRNDWIAEGKYAAYTGTEEWRWTITSAKPSKEKVSNRERLTFAVTLKFEPAHPRLRDRWRPYPYINPRDLKRLEGNMTAKVNTSVGVIECYRVRPKRSGTQPDHTTVRLGPLRAQGVTETFAWYDVKTGVLIKEEARTNKGEIFESIIKETNIEF